MDIVADVQQSIKGLSVRLAECRRALVDPDEVAYRDYWRQEYRATRAELASLREYLIQIDPPRDI